MLTVSEVNRRVPRCYRCECIYNVVSVTPPDQQHLLSLLDRGEVISFYGALMSISGCSLGEAKATYLHLSRTDGYCHYCNEVLPEGTAVDCPKCKALNLVWHKSTA